MNPIADGDSGISTRMWGIIAALVACPLFFVFAVLGDPARGRAAMISAALIFLIIRSRWALRKQIWFRITVACLIAAHFAVVSFVSWQQKSFPGFTLWPIGITDFCAMFGIIKVVEKIVNNSDGATSS